MSRLVGKWVKVKSATDDNNNGQIDSWEQQAVATGKKNVLEFKQDNTGGEYTEGTPDLTFTWMINGEQSLMMIYSTGDTIVSKIAQVNSGNLALTSKAKFGLVGYYYTREN